MDFFLDATAVFSREVMWSNKSKFQKIVLAAVWARKGESGKTVQDIAAVQARDNSG